MTVVGLHKRMAEFEVERATKIEDIDVESFLTRAERRPLTIGRKKSLYQAPEFVKRLSGEETVDEGTTIRFECRVSGFPKPVLKWFKDEENVTNNPRIQIEINDCGNFALVIEKSEKCDEGAYRCRAENAEGVSNSTFYLSIKGKPKKKKIPSKRSVSLSPLFKTIEEKVTEEEVAGAESRSQEPSPLTQFYDSLKLKARHTWPRFLGDWAFKQTASPNRTDSEGSDVDTCYDNDIDGSPPDDVITDDVFVFDFEPSPEISKSNSSNLNENNNIDEPPNKVLFRLGDSPAEESESRTMAPVVNLDSGKAVATERGNPDDDTRDWNLLMLVLSAFTFVALCLHMAPEPFILTVSGGEIIKNLLVTLKRR